MHQEILKHVTSKIELSKEEQREFVGILTEKNIAKKEILIAPGQAVDCEYYVVKGCLKAFPRCFLVISYFFLVVLGFPSNFPRCPW